MLNTGANQAGRPSMGAWLTYGLGTENENLPGYVVLCPDVPTTVGPPLWSNGFLPAINHGTYISDKIPEGPDAEKTTIEKDFNPKKLGRYVNNPKLSLIEQRRELDLLQKIEKMRMETNGSDPQVEGVIKSMEVAYRMQTEAPEVFDIRKESEATLKLYGPGS